MSLTAGELCAGYGGLALAVEEVFGARPVWFSELDPAPSRILAHHWPDVPNLGDMTRIDWTTVRKVDVASGGTPCQDLSTAGARRGMTEGTRSNLWVQMREAVATIRPRYVVWENVRGAYSANADSGLECCPGCVGGTGNGESVLRALGRVLGDLSDLGYDCQWRGLRAADVGAPHGRFRVFILATRRGAAADPDHQGPQGQPDQARTAPAERPGHAGARVNWGRYLGAVRRWEGIRGPAPVPVVTGPSGAPRLNPVFTEWMMGLPAGWITGVPGISWRDALRAAGNGVVPQQAAAALRDMLQASTAAEARR